MPTLSESESLLVFIHLLLTGGAAFYWVVYVLLDRVDAYNRARYGARSERAARRLLKSLLAFPAVLIFWPVLLVGRVLIEIYLLLRTAYPPKEA